MSEEMRLYLAHVAKVLKEFSKNVTKMKGKEDTLIALISLTSKAEQLLKDSKGLNLASSQEKNNLQEIRLSLMKVFLMRKLIVKQLYILTNQEGSL
ncbi:hypothetical protein QNE66_004385 [Vibrio vulnificus]|nr:hypothetical protein [Vibrio vulnificus]